ncbi:hypothetical protein TA3x_005604 [Tundrisphaera sp. TA3]|uniref:hypothetical protein n=1 Tax=Tundrisphaera sp. TA3 TaxID=3435775 RepID=UPI003EBDC22E
MINDQTATATIEMPVAPAVLGEGSTDEQLIAAARKYARSVDGHVRAILDRKRRVIQDFHRLGEMLVYLYRRRSMGDWGKTLGEIGVGTTTDSYARKFFNAVTFERLDEFSSKTEALEKLGILNRKPKAQPESKPGTGPEATSATTDPAAAQNPDAKSERTQRAETTEETAEPAPKPARNAGNRHPSKLITPLAPPTSKDLLAKVVRALEEVGQVGGMDAEALDLLDRASGLLVALRESVIRRDAA